MPGVGDYQTRLTCDCGFDGYIDSSIPYMQAVLCPVCGEAGMAFADDAPLSVLRKTDASLRVMSLTDEAIRVAMDVAQIDGVSVEEVRAMLMILADNGSLTFAADAGNQ
jgi:hypothetical protein